MVLYGFINYTKCSWNKCGISQGEAKGAHIPAKTFEKALDYEIINI